VKHLVNASRGNNRSDSKDRARKREMAASVAAAAVAVAALASNRISTPIASVNGASSIADTLRSAI